MKMGWCRCNKVVVLQFGGVMSDNTGKPTNMEAWMCLSHIQVPSRGAQLSALTTSPLHGQPRWIYAIVVRVPTGRAGHLS
jgi:hypothetical protein